MYDNKATARAAWIVKILCVFTVILAALRLLRLIALPWIWVLGPLWIPAALLLLLYLIDLFIGIYERRK